MLKFNQFRLFKGKKGESAFEVAETSIFYIVMITVIVMIVLAFVFLLGSYTNKLTAVPDKLKAELVASRFINIPECFAYQDPITKRVYSGIIDLEKFNENQMNNCYLTEKEQGHQQLNFKLQLQNKNSVFVKTNNYFKIDHFTLSKKVVVKEGDNFFTDTLLIFVQARPKL
jgi:hypothetical protein